MDAFSSAANGHFDLPTSSLIIIKKLIDGLCPVDAFSSAANGHFDHPASSLIIIMRDAHLCLRNASFLKFVSKSSFPALLGLHFCAGLDVLHW